MIADHAGEQTAMLAVAKAAPGADGRLPLCLHRIPERLIDDRRMLAIMQLPVMGHLADVDGVGEDMVERPPNKRLPVAQVWVMSPDGDWSISE